MKAFHVMLAKHILTVCYKTNKRERIVSTFHETIENVEACIMAALDNDKENRITYIYVSTIVVRYPGRRH